MTRVSLLVLLSCLLLGGCATKKHLPTDWAIPEDESAIANPPIGRFSNFGTSTDPKNKAPDLSQLFFKGFLQGFDIDNLSIAATENQGQLLIQPYAGSSPIVETMLLVGKNRGGGRVDWELRKPIAERLATNILGPPVMLIASQGTTIALHADEKSQLKVDNEGALIIYNKSTAVGLGLLSPRVKYTNEYWFRYPAIDKEESDTGEASAQDAEN